MSHGRWQQTAKRTVIARSELQLFEGGPTYTGYQILERKFTLSADGNELTSDVRSTRFNTGNAVTFTGCATETGVRQPEPESWTRTDRTLACAARDGGARRLVGGGPRFPEWRVSGRCPAPHREANTKGSRPPLPRAGGDARQVALRWRSLLGFQDFTARPISAATASRGARPS